MKIAGSSKIPWGNILQRTKNPFELELKNATKPRTIPLKIRNKKGKNPKKNQSIKTKKEL